MKHYQFFQNRECEYFPCHKGVEEADFNCLFCYCPLYTLGENCSGNFVYTETGVKSCVNCNFPHKRENYTALLKRFPELCSMTARREDEA
ncbi:MAG: cysteine-rich small domain-containing protein [Oscillospiraceae bacterium]|nr:cysteine-rich small domain-containing protein [Oscillospiraceae bacterium]